MGKVRQLWAKALGLADEPIRRKKYANKPVTECGHVFGSIVERDRYRELKIMQKGGLIRDLEVHPSFDLVGDSGQLRYVDSGRVVRYEADFMYLNNLDETVIEDVKGFATSTFRLKRAIMHNMGFRVTVLYALYLGKRRVGWSTKPAVTAQWRPFAVREALKRGRK